MPIFKFAYALLKASFRKLIGEIKLQIQPLSLQMFISLGPKYHDT